MEWIMPIPEEMRFMADSAIQAAAMVMGALVLGEPLFYYRYHSQNLYAIGREDSGGLLRKYEMAELVYGGVYRRLVELGVAEESVSALLSGLWVEAKRSRLSKFGGSRLDTFHTEMQAFRAAFPNPSVGYRLFKYIVVGSATFVLPVRRFYKIRDWYAARHLGRYRQRLFEEDVTVSSFHQDAPEK